VNAQQTVNDGTLKGTAAYIAPEIYRESAYSKQSDIYAFAVLMNEVLAGVEPWAEMNAVQVMMNFSSLNFPCLLLSPSSLSPSIPNPSLLSLHHP
jgi:serine/threonine protein kinase